MTAFSISVRTRTPVLLNRWLALDGVLDGMLEQQGVKAEERIVPLRAWDGSFFHIGLTARQVREAGMVFCASAAIPDDAIIEIDKPISETRRAAIAIPHPATEAVTFKGGVNARLEFEEINWPFASRGTKFVTSRGVAKSILGNQRMIHPGRFEWLAQGDPQITAVIIERAGAIGAKTRNGYGEIIPGSIQFQILENPSPLFGIVEHTEEYGEALVRPTPVALFPSSPSLNWRPPFTRFRQRIETCTPPYWDRQAQIHAFAPMTRFEGLLTF